METKDMQRGTKADIQMQKLQRQLKQVIIDAVIMYPIMTPSGTPSIRKVIQIVFFSAGPKMSTQTGKQIQKKTQQKPEKVRERHRTQYGTFRVNKIRKPQLRIVAVTRINFVFKQLKAGIATNDPRTRPRKTQLPSRPSSVSEVLRSNLRVEAAAGIIPWSILIIRFVKITITKIPQTATDDTAVWGSQLPACS